jgi:hypothetical protein
MDGSTRYNASDSEITTAYQTGSKYSPNAQKSYIKEQRLYISNAPGLKGVRIENGVFEDPLEVHQFIIDSGICPDCACLAATDIEFPIDRNTMGTVVEIAIGELSILLQVDADKTNNAQDDVTTSGRMLHSPQEQQQQQQ